MAACLVPPTFMDLSLETDPILWDKVIWHLVDLADFTLASKKCKRKLKELQDKHGQVQGNAHQR